MSLRMVSEEKDVSFSLWYLIRADPASGKKSSLIANRKKFRFRFMKVTKKVNPKNLIIGYFVSGLIHLKSQLWYWRKRFVSRPQGRCDASLFSVDNCEIRGETLQNQSLTVTQETDQTLPRILWSCLWRAREEKSKYEGLMSGFLLPKA